MERQSYDAIVVGARCAGASLAIHLARAGARVALLEAARLHTDQVLSTHTIHPGGIDLLRELGVGDAVLRETPRMDVVRFEVDGQPVDAHVPAGRDAACPRRFRLDGLLQDEAISARVEVCERTKVVDLLACDGRVEGVRATHGNGSFELRAPITIGADGRHSTVARLVQAEEYKAHDWARGMYWAYWTPSAAWHSADYPYDLLLQLTGNERRVIFPTDGGQLLLGTLPLVEEARNWRDNLEERYLADLRSDPVFAPLIDGGHRESKIVGTVSDRFYFRRSAGPGWALVGDAGHYKDPIVGWGIAEALYQAKHLAAAIADGRPQAYERYWRRRDVDAIPRVRIAEDRSAPGPANPVIPLAMSHVRHDQSLAQRLFRETEFDANPYQLLPVPKVMRWVASAAVKGRPGLLKALAAQVRRIRAVENEVAAARKLLEAVPM